MPDAQYSTPNIHIIQDWYELMRVYRCLSEFICGYYKVAVSSNLSLEVPQIFFVCLRTSEKKTWWFEHVTISIKLCSTLKHTALHHANHMLQQNDLAKRNKKIFTWFFFSQWLCNQPNEWPTGLTILSPIKWKRDTIFSKPIKINSSTTSSPNHFIGQCARVLKIKSHRGKQRNI